VPLVPLKKARTYFSFQRLDLDAQRGLSDMKFDRRASRSRRWKLK
jgi:hypothetical protein